jgi:hypothetical protein
MGGMGSGYGSECHLLRFMGRHRNLLDQRILTSVGGDDINWLDFGFNPSRPWPDAEIKGLDLLCPDDPALAAWRQWWPQGRGIHNWDAVGKVRFGGLEEWLLVEAKANLEELCSDCKATSPTNRPKIERALAETKKALGVPEDRDWLHGYYQFCNRVAVLYFLTQHGIPARLLHLYFLGDRGDPRRTCPYDEEGWQAALRAQEEHVGLPAGHRLQARMHKLFLPIVLEAL